MRLILEISRYIRFEKRGWYLTDGNFKSIFFNENIDILNKMLLNCVRGGFINNKSALVQVMAWGCQEASHNMD